MVQGRRSKEELDAQVRIRRIDATASVANTLIRVSGLCFLGFCAWQSIAALAGHTTLASIGLRALGSVYVSEAAAWLLAVGSVGYGVVQRQLRRREIARFAPLLRDKERAIDPKRTSSQLTDRGDTKPGDQL
jgi:hypothetical protein